MEEKMYISSDGTISKMSDVDTSHLSYSLAKAHRDIYNSTTKEEFNKYIEKMTDIDEELTKRLGIFVKEKFNGDR